MEFARVKTNHIVLNVAQEGPEQGRLLILLHGFPEFWYGWHKHIPVFAQAGFRVWAPDQRGYNLSDKPPRVADYRLEQLGADVEGLILASGCENASIVGHDWGGAVAWWLAHTRPHRVERLVIINVPHPLDMRKLILNSPRQLLRSWYMFLIQIPGLPEWASRRNNWHNLIAGMRGSSLPGTFTEADFNQYRQAWSQADAFPAMLNWYRAMFRSWLPSPPSQHMDVPTLVLWGKRDKFIAHEAAAISLRRCPRGELRMFEQNTHWLQHERPEEICERIVQFLNQ